MRLMRFPATALCRAWNCSIPVATIGGLNDPAQMEEIIASGKADVVYMARALLADPFLPRKVMENRSEDIVHCLRCFTCMAERAATGTRRCTVNPLIGREMEGDEVQPAPVKKKVLIAGGGPGGLYAAWTAARRGHSVVLCEKEVALGGILKSEIALPFKREMFALTETYERFARNAGVEIRLNTEVTPEYVEKEAPDALIIAAGSRPLVPPIKGMDGEQVVVVNELYRNLDKISDKVVVMGGGLAGCECAISLGMEGKEVQLVEMRDALAPDANVRHRPLLLKEIEKQVKAVHTGYRAEEITPESRAQYCEILRDNRRQLRFLFDDMLEVAYLENLHAPLPCQYTNLCAVCQAQLRIMKVRYPKPGIVYKGAIPVAEIALNTSDKYLTILISALLGNAYKFTQEGTISLECDRLGDDRVFVAVAATGCGIPPEKHGYVFERFTKLDPFSQGNGLGLYLCRLIVTHLHGEIYIDSGYTGGTRIVAILPRR